MRLFAEVGGSNIATGGTPFSSPPAATPDYAAAKAFDGNTASFFVSGQSDTWLGYEFPAPVEIKQYAFENASSADARPRSWFFQWSDDGSAWTTVDTRSAVPTGADGVAANYTLSAYNIGHRYWSLLITEIPSINEAIVPELRMRTVAGGANIALGKTYSGTASSYDVAYGPLAAFDNSVASDKTYQPGSNSLNARAIVDFTTPVKIVEWEYDPGALPGFCAKSFSLCWSDDGTSWTVADARTAQTFTSGVPKTFTVP